MEMTMPTAPDQPRRRLLLVLETEFDEIEDLLD
jgi:hypothetical protein